MAELLTEKKITVQQLPDKQGIEDAVNRELYIHDYWDQKTPYIKLNGKYFRMNNGHKLPQLVDISRVSAVIYKGSTLSTH
jgi:hypothetical protein